MKDSENMTAASEPTVQERETAPERRETKAIREALGLSLGLYAPDGLAAMRCVAGDAAAVCDAIASDIISENRGYGGKGPVTKRGQELAAIAKRCGDAIWAMREQMTAKDSENPSYGRENQVKDAGGKSND